MQYIAATNFAGIHCSHHFPFTKQGEILFQQFYYASNSEVMPFPGKCRYRRRQPLFRFHTTDLKLRPVKVKRTASNAIKNRNCLNRDRDAPFHANQTHNTCTVILTSWSMKPLCICYRHRTVHSSYSCITAQVNWGLHYNLKGSTYTGSKSETVKPPLCSAFVLYIQISLQHRCSGLKLYDYGGAPTPFVPVHGIELHVVSLLNDRNGFQSTAQYC